MAENGDVEHYRDMHIDCAGEYEQISRAEAQGDREWAENEVY